MPDPQRVSRAWVALGCVLAAALFWAALRLSWLSDDAFILFRAAENLVQGRGPVWNAGERVQTFTQPLWFFLFSGLRLCTGEHVITAQVAGLVLSALAVRYFLKLPANAAAAAVMLGLLLGSRSWASFATSGMETALNYLLAAALLLAWRLPDAAARQRRVAIVCGLFGLSRFDLLALTLPPLAVACLGAPWPRTWRSLAVGLAPLVAWGLFATVYYGFLFPVTAYAKAFTHGVPLAEILAQGLRYWQRACTDDPVTPAVIAAGIVVGLARPGQRGLALGVLGYSLYTLKVGGDYMLGRFLMPPFTVALGILVTTPALGRPLVALATLALTAVLALLPGIPEAATPPPNEARPERIPADGIVDEQLPRQWNYGLLAKAPEWSGPGSIGALLHAAGLEHALTVRGVVGWAGYAAGERVLIVDPWLLDPLLARLPVGDPAFWRIGHFYRRLPAGYLETLAAGENRLQHAGLARYHEALASAVHDPIWSAARWRHLWDLWTGALDAGLVDYLAHEYRTPSRIEVPIAELAAPVPAPGYWFQSRGRTAQTGGLAVTFPEPCTARTLIAHCSGVTTFTFRFRRDGETLATMEVPSTVLPPDALAPLPLDVPPAARPFDSIWIDAKVELNWPCAAFVGRIEVRP